MSPTGLLTAIHRLRRRLHAEEGIVLVAVMGVMGVLLLVTAYVASGSEGLSTQTNEDRDAKRALAAAEAGLAVATEELSETPLTANQCLTNVGATTVNPPTECTAPTTAQTVSLGDNTSYRFLASQQQVAGCTSGHTPVTGAPERCVTAYGRANGVERRLFRPVQTSAAMFSQAGVVGLNSLYFDNSNTATGSGLVLGTNGQVTMVNSNTINGAFNLPTTAPPIIGSGGSGWSRTNRATPWSLESVGIAMDQAWASNNNGALAGTIYNSTTRRFELGNGVTASLPGGGAAGQTYIFCEMRLAQSSQTLNISGTGQARVFVDSPFRAGSPCPTPEVANPKRGRGRVIFNNSAKVNLAGGVGANGAAQRLQIVVAGTGDEVNNFGHVCPDNNAYKQDVLLCNSVEMNATIYAPNSTAHAINSVKIGGAIAAAAVRFVNSVEFQQPNGLTGLLLPVLREGQWFECKRAPSIGTDRESGCIAP